MKKLLLITLVPMTFSVQAAFVMKEGQPLKKTEYSSENTESSQNTENSQNTQNSVDTISYELNNNTNDTRIQLRMPNIIKVLKGDNLNIYLDNIVNVANISSLSFVFYVNGKLQKNYKGTFGKNRYITMSQLANGDKLRVTIGLDNKIIASANSKIITYSKNASNKSLKILTIGDSFTDGADILIPLKKILNSAGQSVTFLGTRSNSGISHEGKGGWTAAAYMNLNPQWYPNSPFLKDGKINFSNYIKTRLEATPNIVIIQLGVNDILDATKGIAKGYYSAEILKKKVEHIALLLKSIQSANIPNLKILMLMPSPANRSVKGISRGMDVNNYKDSLQTYYKYYLNTFENKEAGGVYVIPSYLSIDPWNEFNTGDLVHPNIEGYKKIADSISGELF